MQWILVSLLLSFISVWIFWDQSPVLTYRVSAQMLSFLFFFYLYKKSPPVSFIEKFVLFFAFLFCVLWLYAFSQIPHLVFGSGEDGLVNENISRGIIRLRLSGSGFLVMGFFIALNKFYTTRKKLFIAFAVLFYVFIILFVTRQIIFWSAIVAAGYIYSKNKKLSIVIIVIFLLFAMVGFRIKISNDSIIGSLINVTTEQVDRNESKEDIRITEYKYFMGKYSKNVVTSIFGNGMPHSFSSYGQYVDNLKIYDRLFLSDVGYAMMFAVTGVVGLIIYLLLFFKSAFTKVPDELSYARMFMIYFIFANIAASWYSKPDWQICMAISVYLLMMYGKTKSKAKT